MNQEGITAHGNATITLKAKENNKLPWKTPHTAATAFRL